VKNKLDIPITKSFMFTKPEDKLEALIKRYTYFETSYGYSKLNLNSSLTRLSPDQICEGREVFFVGRVTFGNENKIEPMEAIVEYLDKNDRAHRVEVDFSDAGCNIFFPS